MDSTGVLISRLGIFLLKTIRFPWNSRLKLLTFSSVLLNTNQSLTLQFLADWVPSMSHFLKSALSRRVLPCVNERPLPSGLSCLNTRDFSEKDIGAMCWLHHGMESRLAPMASLGSLTTRQPFELFQPYNGQTAVQRSSRQAIVQESDDISVSAFRRKEFFLYTVRLK